MTGTPGRLRGLPAALSLGAAAIHFAAAPDHFSEFAPYGIAFAGLGWFQVVWAVASLQGPGRVARVAAIGVNAAAVGVWLASRSVGLPFGPAPGVPEPIALGDALATAFEVLLVTVLVLGRRRRADSGSGRFTPAFGAALVAVAAVATVGIAAIASSHAQSHGAAVLVPEPFPTPTPKPTPAAPPAVSTTTPLATVSSFPPAPTPEATGLAIGAMAVIQFGTRLGSGGELYETGSTFELGQVVVWKVELGDPVGSRPLLFQVVKRLADGREVVHWEEAFVPRDPAATEIVAASDLALFAHDGAGTYLIRYLRGLAIVAEGSVTLTAP